MARYMVATLLLFLIAAPAFGKAHNNIYPVSCDDLWDAVRDTLGNKGNYSVMASDNSGMTASYLVVGSQRQRAYSVLLNPKDPGCELQVKTLDNSVSDDEEGLFRNRVGHTLDKLQAAKASGGTPPKRGR